MAKEVGIEINNAYIKPKNVLSKQSDVDLVTETDKNVENYIIKSIKDTFPDHEFIGEESVAASNYAKIVLNDKPTWVVDPVDGTTNFVHKFPYTCVCIGFMVNKVTEFGVVFNPIMNELFSARRNFGATMNEKIINVSPVSSESIQGSLIISEFGSSREEKRINYVFENMQNILKAGSHGIRSLGSAAMNICSVAIGRADAYYEAGMHIWDICAAGLILREAGGATIDINGEELNLCKRRIIAASNGKLAKHISETITCIELEYD